MKEQTLYLDPAIINSTLERFYSDVVGAEFEFEWAGGHRGHNYKIQAGDETFLLKIYRDRSVLPWNHFNYTKLESIYGVQGKLRQAGIPVQKAHINRYGVAISRVYLLRMHFAILLDYLLGQHLKPDQITHDVVEKLIDVTVKLDMELAKIDPPAELNNPPVERVKLQLSYFDSELVFLLGIKRSQLQEIGQSVEEVIQLWQTTKNRLEQGLVQAAPRGQLVHSDLTPHNILFQDGEIAGVLDFDKLQLGFCEEELGVVLGSWQAWLNLAKRKEKINILEVMQQRCSAGGLEGVDWQLVPNFAQMYLWADYSFALNRLVHHYDRDGALNNLANTWSILNQLS